MVVKTVFFVSRGHFWRNNFLFQKIFKAFSCFQTLRITFRIFGEKNLVGLSKLFSSVQGIFSEEFVFENKFLEFFFWSLDTNFLHFLGIFCDKFVKTAFYVSSGDFWLDCNFYENLWVFSPSSGCGEKFWHFGAKTSKNLSKLQFMSTKNFWGRFDFWKRFYNFVEYWSKFLRIFCQKRLS